jgi:hypothetical protein
MPERCGICNSRESLSNSLRDEGDDYAVSVCAIIQTVSRVNFVAGVCILHSCLHNTFACTGSNQDL